MPRRRKFRKSLTWKSFTTGLLVRRPDPSAVNSLPEPSVPNASVFVEDGSAVYRWAKNSFIGAVMAFFHDTIVASKLIGSNGIADQLMVPEPVIAAMLPFPYCSSQLEDRS